MDLRALVNEIADQADDFLAGVTRRNDARAGIAEWLTIHHPKLPPADKKAATDQALALLDNEGFFDAEAGGDPDDEPGSGFSEASEE